MKDVIFYQNKTGGEIVGYMQSGSSGGTIVLMLTERERLVLWEEDAEPSGYLYNSPASELFQDPFNPTPAERTLFELNFNMPYPPQEMLSKLQYRS